MKRKCRIERQLAGLDARAKERQRKLDTRRKIVAGAIVLKHAETDPAFAKELGDLLERFVLDRDRHLFGLPEESPAAGYLTLAFNMVAAVPQSLPPRRDRTPSGP